MAKRTDDKWVKLEHKDTGEIIRTRKNKKKLSGIRLELKKFSQKLKKHVVFKETK